MTGAPDHTTAAADHRRRTLMAIGLTVAAYASFNVGDAVMKLLAQKFGTAQLMVVNGLLVAGFMIAYGFYKEGRNAFRVHNPRWVALRAVFALGTGVCNVLALPHVTLTAFYMLVFTSPFCVAMLSALFLGEKMESRRLAVILFGFGVVGYILRPGGDMLNSWSLLVLFSALLYSCSIVTMRYLGTRESRTVIISSGALLGVVAALPFLPGHFTPMTLVDGLLFLLMGGIGAFGVACIAYAFQTAPSAAVIAPFHYTQMIWGAILGYMLFGDVPKLSTLVGAGLLIAGGLALIWLETRAMKASPAEALPFRAGGWFSRLRAYSPSPKER